MDYVVHYCKNKNCNNAFVAEDYTKVRDIPPHWRLCPDCCKELGIDYEKQRPWNMRDEKTQKRIKEQIERLIYGITLLNFASLTPHPSQTT